MPAKPCRITFFASRRKVPGNDRGVEVICLTLAQRESFIEVREELLVSWNGNRSAADERLPSPPRLLKVCNGLRLLCRGCSGFTDPLIP